MTDTAASSRSTVQDREAWVLAATAALGREGLAGVRVEALARDLGTSKGSFYWHFRDRRDLLEAVLEWWELETRWLIGSAREADTPFARLERYCALMAEHREYPADAEILSWARRDPEVALRVAQTEALRLEFFEAELAGSASLPRAEATRRARIAYFALQGWVEQASRGQERYPELPGFARHLFRLLSEPDSR